MKYSFHPYHSFYIERAQAEILRIKSVLPKNTIEHIGSTSIPGVGGKGIIDLYILEDRKNLNETSEIIQKLGYVFRPSGGIPGERLFHKRTEKYQDGHKQTFHIHLTYKGNKDWESCIEFRNFLRQNPDLAEEYSHVKLEAVKEAKKFRTKNEKKEAYMKIKKPVIDRIMRLMSGR